MWYLEEFDKSSQQLMREFALIGIDTNALQSILGFDDTYEIDGISYPPEAGGYDISPKALRILKKHINEPFVPDPTSFYQTEFYAD